MNEDSKIRLDKLNENNYQVWRFKITSILEERDVESLIVDDPEDNEEWKKKDKKTRALIRLMVSDEIIPFIANANTTKETWEILEKRFNSKTGINKYFLRRKLYQSKKLDTESMNLYISKIRNIDQSLRMIDVILADDEITSIILNGLPKSYETVIANLESIDGLTSVMVESRLILEEQKMNEDMDEKVAYNTTTKNNYENYKKNFHNNNKKNKNIICFNFKKKGHIAKQCRKTKNEKNNNNHHTFLAFGTYDQHDQNWYIDSGASDHMCWNIDLFDSIDSNSEKIFFGDGSFIESKGRGNVSLQLDNDNKITLMNVMYIPSLQRNLFSISKLVQLGGTAKFDSKFCLMKKGDSEMKAIKCGDLFKLVIKNITLNLTQYDSSKLWHRRLGHIGEESMRKIMKELKCAGSYKVPFCSVCSMANNVRKPFSKKAERTTKILDLIHSDVFGPVNPSLNGSRYYVSFTDDFSRYSVIYFIKNKFDVLQKFIQYKCWVEKQCGSKIKTIRFDGGGEFVNNSFKEYLINQGITRKITVPYTPQQNGVAERLNRSLISKARSMLIEARLGDQFWAEAVSTSNYLKNILPSKSLNDATPFELFFNKKPKYELLRVWGCESFVKIQKPKSKLHARSKKMLFMGYDGEYSGYRFWDGNRIIMSRDAIFNENENNTDNSLHQKSQSKECNDVDYLRIFDFENDNQSNNSFNNEEIINDEINNPVTEENDENVTELIDQPDPIENSEEKQVKLRRSSRIRNMPESLENYVINKSSKRAINLNAIAEPQSWKEAIDSNESDNWKQAMQEDFNTLTSMQTWKLVDKPPDANVLTCKWVFKKKLNPDGSTNKYKARLVAKGFKQKYGVDYKELFSPVVKYNTIRIMLSFSAIEDYEIHHLDVNLAFLHGDLQEKIYMEQPPMFNDGSGKVLVLIKALYGLKQSPRQWNEKIDNVLKNNDWNQSKVDCCLYFKDKSYILIYVDDLILIAKSKHEINNMKTMLINNFQMKDLGELTYFLGIEINRDRGRRELIIKQSAYISRLIKKFNMQGCKHNSTPMDMNNIDSSIVNNDDKKFPYAELVGSLIYLSTTTRPDIAFAVGVLSRNLNNYNVAHWNAAKRVLKYLSGTKNLGIKYEPSDTKLCAYSDADFGGDIETRKSTTGYCVLYNGGAVIRKSQRQSIVTLSTMESEYVALTATAQEVVWTKKLMNELDQENKSFMIFEDNRSTLALLKDPVFHQRSKHIDIKFHFLKDLVKTNEISATYCPTENMIADIFTKRLSYRKFEYFRNQLNMVSSQSEGVLEEDCTYHN